MVLGICYGLCGTGWRIAPGIWYGVCGTGIAYGPRDLVRGVRYGDSVWPRTFAEEEEAPASVVPEPLYQMLAQYRAVHSKVVAPYASSVPHYALAQYRAVHSKAVAKYPTSVTHSVKQSRSTILYRSNALRIAHLELEGQPDAVEVATVGARVHPRDLGHLRRDHLIHRRPVSVGPVGTVSRQRGR
eukprot:3112632-Rhodomonas_salina.1